MIEGQMHRLCSDPMERIVQDALDRAGIRYILEGEVRGAGQTLDFYLPDMGIYIECKQFHSDRIADQMSRAPNVIVLQGVASAKMFAAMLMRSNYMGNATP